MTTTAKYEGTELELFADATRWKSYVRRKLTPYLGRRVAEIGAGLGGTTKMLCVDPECEWVCVEPDAELAAQLRDRIATEDLPACCRVAIGTVETLFAEPKFDTVLYIDVLEHIEDDRGELRKAANLLSPGGRLVVLSPAHQWLYSPFDKAIGHFRRYSRKTLTAAGQIEGLRLETCFYLDSVGVLASLANRLLMRQSKPTVGQIRFWDRCLVPASRLIDPVLFFSLGKSVIGVWTK